MLWAWSFNRSQSQSHSLMPLYNAHSSPLGEDEDEVTNNKNSIKYYFPYYDTDTWRYSLLYEYRRTSSRF
jgi:hypothetical protein